MEMDRIATALRGLAALAVPFLFIWGIFGLMQGDGFLEGIGKQIDALGDLFALLVKAALVLGALFGLDYMIKNRKHRKDANGDL